MDNTPFTPSTADEIRTIMLEEMLIIVGDTSPDLLGELASLFLADVPPLVAKMARAVANQDAIQIQEAAHTLKGSSGSMGFRRLSSLCYEMEQLTRAKQPHQIGIQLANIEAEFQVVCQVLEEYLMAS